MKALATPPASRWFHGERTPALAARTSPFGFARSCCQGNLRRMGRDSSRGRIHLRRDFSTGSGAAAPSSCTGALLDDASEMTVSARMLFERSGPRHPRDRGRVQGMRGCDRQSLRGSPDHWSAHRMEWRFSVILSDNIRLERYTNVTARYRLPPALTIVHGQCGGSRRARRRRARWRLPDRVPGRPGRWCASVPVPRGRSHTPRARCRRCPNRRSRD